MINDEVIPHV